MRRAAVALAAIALMSSPAAHGSGFYINEQSPEGLGRAFSGEVVLGDDASGLWYNPALALAADGPTATSGVFGIFSNGEITDRGTTLSGPGLSAARPVGGAGTGEPLDPAAVPTLGFAMPLGRRAAIGFNVNAPFGLVVDYSRGFFGRYASTRTELTTINLQGTAAIAATHQLWLGAGVNAQYAEAVLENALPNLVPGAGDGFAQVKGDDWSWGWSVGGLWRPMEDWRFGASYRSAIEHDLEGEQNISGLVGPLGALNGRCGGAAALDLPAIAMVGVAHTPSPDWTLSAQANWFEWSNFQEIRVRTPGRPDTVRPQRYEDSLALSIGVEHRVSDAWRWRAGLMRESTPSEPEFRSARVPDSDRHWITAGASWSPNERMTFDIGAAYVTLEGARVSRTDVLFEGSPAQRVLELEADISGDALIAGLGGTLRFQASSSTSQ